MTAVGTSIGMATGAGVVGLLVQSTSRPDAYVFPVLWAPFTPFGRRHSTPRC
jgi:hypothetical protein